jgi:hypothetical protein
MSMSHKAFAFDWWGFDSDLAPIMLTALEADTGTYLGEFIERERDRLTDPYEGEPLRADWQRLLEAGDVQELADFALTRYYSVREDHGVGGAWLRLSDSLSDAQSEALLGTPTGSRERLFDPGRLGSYFQSPPAVRRSLATLSDLEAKEVQPFRELLKCCDAQGLGIYVTF